jgi:CAAX prenyl protease-like protein
MKSFWLIAPYAVWMALMAMLPSTAAMYAVRSSATAATLLLSAWKLGVFSHCGGAPAKTLSDWRNWLWGAAGGVIVLVIWTVPENFGWYRDYFIVGDAPIAEASPYDPSVCGWTLTIAKLLGSAFVISVAEELFFRRWLVNFAGFWWMVALFSIEHDRPAVAAAAGVIYGVIALKRGIFAVSLAHAVTNLLLGAWIIYSGNWAFW